jgi:hypothetical protein
MKPKEARTPESAGTGNRFPREGGSAFGNPRTRVSTIGLAGQERKYE